MTDISAIIFDWGGVLISDQSREIVSYFAGKLNKEEIEVKKALEKFLPEFQLGNIGEPEFWEDICTYLDCKYDRNLSWEEAFLSYYQPNIEMVELLGELSKKYKIGLITDTEAPIANFLLGETYMLYVDCSIISCYSKQRKPDKIVYNNMLSRLNVRPDEAVYIDNAIKNVEGSVAAGIHGIHYTNTEDLKLKLCELGIKA